MKISTEFPPSPRRTRIARCLRRELGMSYKAIGDYMGLDHTSVRHMINHGTTSSKPRKKPSWHFRHNINIGK